MDIKSSTLGSMVVPILRRKINTVWKNENEYAYFDRFPERAKNQEKFTRIWLTEFNDLRNFAIDLGCADGWHSKILANYFDSVLGIDLNPKFIEIAEKENNSDSLKYVQGNEKNLLNYSGYSLISICGFLTYIPSKNSASKILKNIFNSLPNGGLVLAKDTLVSKSRSIVRLNKNYACIYRDEKSWYDLFYTAGFGRPIKSTTLESNNNGFKSEFALFKKVEFQG
jgi:2-polyprenyl-3-methyl-5-hydroxy-6-metoxy-1,4-benzoquinol methylase